MNFNRIFPNPIPTFIVHCFINVLNQMSCLCVNYCKRERNGIFENSYDFLRFYSKNLNGLFCRRYFEHKICFTHIGYKQKHI